MKWIKTISILIIIILVSLLFLEVIPTAPKYQEENSWIIKEGDKPLIVPHAGAKLLFPENTIYSFKQISLAGYDVFEVDLALTGDNLLISSHDVTILRLTDEDIKVRDQSYEKLAKYNYAKNFVNLEGDKPFENVTDETLLSQLRPAKLEDLFIEYPNQKYILELKDTVENSGEETFKYAVNALLQLIEEYDMYDKVMVSSFDDEVTTLIQKESSGKVMTSTATKESFNFVIYNTLKVDFFYRPKDGAVVLPFKDDLSDSQVKLLKKAPGFIRNQVASYDETDEKYYTNLVRKSIIDDAHRHNMAALYYTVNDKEDMKTLINLGVDGIITDRPDLLKEVLEELGY